MDRGSFTQYEGRPAVRFEREYPRPVERLWSALTETGELAHWFPSTVRMEGREGGEIRFSDDPHLASMTGTVTAYDPPRLLAYTWGSDELRFELTPADGGGCVLTLLNILGERDAAARNAAGWDVCLGELDKHLADGTAAGPHSDTALPWRERYDAYIGAGMPHGAPIPGQ